MTTDTQLASRARDATMDAFAAHLRSERSRAEAIFHQAIALADQVQAPALRRSLYGTLAVRLLQCGFADLAQRVTEASIALDHDLADIPHLAEDLLNYAWALHAFHEAARAEEVFQRARDLCLSHDLHALAATAAVHLAEVIMPEGRLAEAERLLTDALNWLHRQPSPGIEIKATQALLHVLEVLDEPPARSFAAARSALDRVGPQMGASDRADLFRSLRGAIDRFIARAPEVDRRQWIMRNFPELMWADRPMPEVAAPGAGRGLRG
jgi:tetratricopeptide (TPR) repeat protein